MYQQTYFQWTKVTPKGQWRQKETYLNTLQYKIFIETVKTMTLEEAFTGFTGIKVDETIKQLRFKIEYRSK